MIALIASIIIIVIFASEARKNYKSPIKWALIGLLSFWLTSLLPAYLLVEFAIGHRNDTLGIILILIVVFTFFGIGVITCQKVYKYLKK